LAWLYIKIEYELINEQDRNNANTLYESIFLVSVSNISPI
jgi:hypothetical protein